MKKILRTNSTVSATGPRSGGDGQQVPAKQSLVGSSAIVPRASAVFKSRGTSCETQTDSEFDQPRHKVIYFKLNCVSRRDHPEHWQDKPLL
jgi:hypothetical protein